MTDIDPARYYSFAEAITFIPSSRKGNICVRTLRNWAKAGRFVFEVRKSGHHLYSFVRGSELIRLLAPERRHPILDIETPVERQRRHKKAMQRLREHGVIK